MGGDLRFIHLPAFSRAWDRLGLTDDDLRALEASLMSDPTQGVVVPGTGGLRKVRFAAKHSHRGKRGGYRVCYVHYERFFVIALATAYDKTDKADLDSNETKAMRALIRAVQGEIERGS